MSKLTDFLDGDIFDTIIKIGSKAFGSGGSDEPSKGFATRHSAQTSFPMPDAPRGTYGYITGTPYQLNASRQAMTQLERLMEVRNKAMQTGVDALANKYVRDAINSANTVSGKDLSAVIREGMSNTKADGYYMMHNHPTGSPNITLGSTKI